MSWVYQEAVNIHKTRQSTKLLPDLSVSEDQPVSRESLWLVDDVHQVSQQLAI